MNLKMRTSDADFSTPASGTSRARRRGARSRLGTVVAAVAAAAAATAGVAGCSSPPPSQATDSDTVIQVVAAESVWGEIAAQIGGPHVRVTDIVGGGGSSNAADPQTFQPSPADTKAIAGAQVFILNGAGLDPWANQAAAADPGVGRLDINVGNEVGVDPGQDPYLWYDSDYVNAAVQKIEQDFTQLRPDSAAYFGQQVAAFEQSAAATNEALAGMIKQQFKGKSVGVCPGMAQQVAGALGLKPVVATSAQIAAKQIKVLICGQGADPGDAALLKAASTAKIRVVQLSRNLGPAGTTFQAWLTPQLNEIDQALTGA